MQKNNIINEYWENLYSKEKNYNSIKSKIKNQINIKRKIINTAAILLIVITLGTTSSIIYAKKNWNEEYEEYLNRYIASAKSSVSLETVNENAENLNMDYIYNDGIGVKINSLLITDYTCKIDVDFKFSDEYFNNEYEAFEFGYAIYDDNNNIYEVYERNKYNAGQFLQYEKKLCRELGIKYNTKKAISLAKGGSLNTISMEPGNTIMRLGLRATNKFPRSKKLYIRIFDIGYALVNYSPVNETEVKIESSEDFQLSNSEWQFEIEIPDKFYDKTYTELELAKEINGIEIEKATLSDTELVLIINSNYSMIEILKGIYISDDSGNIYTLSGMSDNNELKLIYNIGNNTLDKKLFLNLDIPKYNINEKVELVIK